LCNTRDGARHRRGLWLPPSVQVMEDENAGRLSARSILVVVARVRPCDLILVKGVPHLLGDFFAEQGVDEQFLTLAPRSPAGTVRRSARDDRREALRAGASVVGNARWGQTRREPPVSPLCASLLGVIGGGCGSGLCCCRNGEKEEPGDDRTEASLRRPSLEDGLRVLVEGLWPRGLSKVRAAVDLWLKDVAPSPQLRKWFGHDPARWEQFQERYRKKLREKKDAVQILRQKGKEGTVTLVYAARDEEHNGALALKRLLQGN
jgi:uncharacterized protein YeaO (DUF488 family)